MIRRPGAENLYGYLEEEQKMPASEGQLTEADLATLVRYLKGDYLRTPAPATTGKAVATSP